MGEGACQKSMRLGHIDTHVHGSPPLQGIRMVHGYIAEAVLSNISGGRWKPGMAGSASISHGTQSEIPTAK